MIRIATEKDVPEILEIYGPYIENTTFTFEYDIPCRKEFLQRFYTITAQYPWLVWEEEGKILGYAYGSAPFERAAYRWCAEDSLYLHPDARRKGIGTKLLAALEDILKLQGYRTVYAIITSENSVSLDFHRKMGYNLLSEFPDCGYKFGRWLGVTWLDKVLKTVECPIDFPASWQTLMQDDKKFSDILDILSLS